MNMAVPYMTYQMTPMMMGSAGFAGAGMMAPMMGSAGFAGAGMMGGGFGMPFGAGMPLVLPAGGLNLGTGLGGGLQLNLGGNGLAAALGLAGPGGLSAGGTSALEMQLLRALLGRGTANGTANGADTGQTAPPAVADAEAQMRRLNANIAEMTTRINTELANFRQMRDDTDQNSFALEKIGERLQKIEQRLEALDKGGKKSGAE
jgi:hypothetical protein